MKLEKFTKNKNQKRIVIGSIIGLILLIGGIYLYKTYALYEEKKEFNVLKGRIPDFSNLTVKYIVEEEEVSTAPSKDSGYAGAVISCSGVIGAKWDNVNWKVSYSASNLTSKEVSCTVIFKQYLSNYLINLSNSDASIVEVEHEETVQTPALTDYRYTGKDPNNYVYFGCNEDCTNDNLYRIIGVIPTQEIVGSEYVNRVKLIKNDYYTETKSGYLVSNTAAPSGKGYSWNANGSNNWTVGTLNTKVLNGVYWNNLGDYQNYIGASVWYLGAFVADYNQKLSTYFYTVERGSGKAYNGGGLNTIANIGIMYASDYAYAIEKIYWNNAIPSDAEKYRNNAWLLGLTYSTSSMTYEHVLNPGAAGNSSTGKGADILIYSSGQIGSGTINVRGVRPTFYLKLDVLYKSGDGSLENPYRLTISN